MRSRRVIGGVLCLVLGSAASAQQTPCPNPPVGPLIGTTSEYCLTSQESSNVDFGKSVFVTTTIGPQTTVNFSNTVTVARARWTNNTYVPMLCALAAHYPSGPNGGSAGGFTEGQASGCTGIVTQEMCLSLFQGGVTLMAQQVAACPVPTPPPCGGGPPAQSKTATCPCPFTNGRIPECSEVVVPITGQISGTTNYIDCTDSANWTDLNGNPQSKTCFNARQRCTCATISGPYLCDMANATLTQTNLNCTYPWYGTIPPQQWIWVLPSTPNVEDDIPGDGFDPPHDGE